MTKLPQLLSNAHLLQTAKALGIAMRLALLARADEVLDEMP